MILTLANSVIDRHAKQDINELHLSHEDLKTLIETPNISESKHDATAIFPFEMSYTDGESYLIGQNALYLTALILDIDHDYDIDKWIENYKHLKYYLYTTHSHTSEFNRFRVILPLKYKVPMKLFNKKYIRSFLKKTFPFADKQAFKFMSFIAPNHAQNSLYYSKYNEGASFNLKDFKEEVLMFKSKQKAIDKYTSIRREQKLKKYINKSVSVRHNRKVRDYLDAPISDSGMGLLSYIAICVCTTSGDMETLELVKHKMVLDSFTEYEINRAITNAMG